MLNMTMPGPLVLARTTGELAAPTLAGSGVARWAAGPSLLTALVIGLLRAGWT
jgi:hypothetical protein